MAGLLRCPPRRHSSAVEQLFRKQQVLGSNPSVGSTRSNVKCPSGDWWALALVGTFGGQLVPAGAKFAGHAGTRRRRFRVSQARTSGLLRVSGTRLANWIPG